MSNTINNGGPAFPIPLNEGQHYQGHSPCDGMTLRDYFAAKAMQALMHEEKKMSYDNISVFAYAVADSMLRARGEA